jgi:hypothetical protein
MTDTYLGAGIERSIALGEKLQVKVLLTSMNFPQMKFLQEN